MDEQSQVSFLIQRFQEALAVTPVVNGIPLTELISTFERTQHYEPAGGYGGLIPTWFKYGALERYFLGDVEEGSYFARIGGIYLLGCECGEVGCWPLQARVVGKQEAVTWDSFRQPHRPERDYSGFGPFSFSADQYRAAVRTLCAELDSERTR